MEFTQEKIREEFVRSFSVEPLLVRSPGRINLIGEHVDYNQGLVLPAAIDKEIFLAVAKSDRSQSMVRALNFSSSIQLDAGNPTRIGEPYWANYLLGVLAQFKARGMEVRQFNCVIGGNIPSGAGLSSSAALECGFAFAINELFGFGLSRADMIAMALWSEHNYVGVKCGIMDQFSSMMGKKDHVISLDCRTLDFSYEPISFPGYKIVLIDSRVKHSLGTSEYNTRREECESGLASIQEQFEAVRSLRDVSLDMLQRSRSKMSQKVFRRCLFVVQEIVRVQQSVVCLRNKDPRGFGKLMFESHEGLSELYEVSCKELNFLVDKARLYDGVVGSRMMGGGFGGCSINLLYADFIDEFVSETMQAYREMFGIDPETYEVGLSDGTSLVKPIS